jgi:hypothetical protein
MKRILIFAMLWFAVPALPAFGEMNEIMLEDGSIIRAEIVSFENGNYTLRSESMGTFSLNASHVRRINSRGGDPAPVLPLAKPSPDALNARVKDAQAALMNDPESMRMVTARIIQRSK